MLGVVGLEAAAREFIDTEGASEKTARVAGRFQLYEPCISEHGRMKSHGLSDLLLAGSPQAGHRPIRPR